MFVQKNLGGHTKLMNQKEEQILLQIILIFCDFMDFSNI